MGLKKYKSNDDFNDLDGSTIDVDTSLIEAPTKNIYFVGIFPFAMGIAALWVAFFHYSHFIDDLKLTEESWIFLVLGTLFFCIGFIMLLKAGVYLLTLKPFLQKAKFTKCNVKCVIATVKRSMEGSGSYQIKLYNLLASYVDENGRQRTKVFKYWLAEQYCQIYEWKFGVKLKRLLCVLYFIKLDNYFTMAYNKRGKAVLVYERF